MFKEILMIEEFAIGILKALACIVRFLIEAGIDLGLKDPGKALLKIIWPPNWVKKVTYDGPLLYALGVCFYLLLFKFVIGFCCA